MTGAKIIKQPGPDKRMIDQIIAGAERAFLESGYDLTSMESVAQQAKVARASVYNHFANKEELFLAVMRRGTSNFVERAMRADKLHTVPLDRLRSLATNFLRAAVEPVSLEMYRTVVAQAERFSGLSQLFYSQGLQPIEDRFLLILSHAEDQLIETPALAADRLLSSLMGGYFARRLLGAETHAADRSIEEYVERAIASLFKNQNRASSRA